MKTDAAAADTVSRNPGELGLRLVADMPRITHDRVGDAGLENARVNRQYLEQGRSLKALRAAPIGRGNRAVVIAAGPSLHRGNVAASLKNHAFDGAIIATESAMLYCLRNGIVPDLVVTLDPHATRIVRWFGDPNLSIADIKADDYYSRQDMDISFADEMRTNEEILGLLDRHGPQMRIAIATSASKSVVNRVLQTGMQTYWWNPMYDDPDAPDSITRSLYEMNGLPCVNAGGNVGSACWMMAHAVLGKTHVALTGIDFSYYDGTPYRNTQYYRDAVDLVGEENLDTFFIRIFNPIIGKWFYADPAYLWYRNAFLEMAEEAECMTYNCTEGGILFGGNIRFVPLQSFLADTHPESTDPRIARI